MNTASSIKALPARVVPLAGESLLVLLTPNEPAAETCDSKTALKYFAAEPFPVCPICLRQDSIPYERLSWPFRAIPFCVEHRCWLIAHCPNCGKRLNSFRLRVTTCRCGRTLAHMHPAALNGKTIDAAETLHALFLKRTSILPDMSPAAMCWWTERLASAVGRTPGWIEPTRNRLGLEANLPAQHVAWLAGAQIVRSWPEGLHRLLDAFRNRGKPDDSSIGFGFPPSWKSCSSFWNTSCPIATSWLRSPKAWPRKTGNCPADQRWTPCSTRLPD